MSEITASLVKQLREQTGVGMMDCKRALTETAGDIDKAIDWLRRKGLASAAKKAGRVASEGLIAVAVDSSVGALVEVNAETDFVARNDEFQNFARSVANLAVSVNGDLDRLKTSKFSADGIAVSEKLIAMVGRIGENMVLRRSCALSVKEGVVASYIHNSVGTGLGKIGVLVGLESTGDLKNLNELGRKIAMHVCAARPEAIDRDSLDPSSLQRERDVLIEQAKTSGKPVEIIEKMVDGRLRKYYEEVVLGEQIYVIDGENKVNKVIELASKEINSAIRISGFKRFELGEGIEKREENFATEVAAQVEK